MDATHIILTIIIVVLLIDRAWDRYRVARQQDIMNRAILAKNVAEYDYRTKDEIKKLKVENDLVIKAAKLEQAQDDRGPHFPVT